MTGLKNLGLQVPSGVMGRRAFLRASALAGGGFMLAYMAPAGAARLGGSAPKTLAQNEVNLTPWIRITQDNRITIISSQAELGQGISTTLPAIIADELGADWSAVSIETAPFAPAFRNPRVNFMFTGNSESAQAFYDLMRKTGAAAREMLVAAAASRWGVAPDACVTEQSAVLHVASTRRLSFGEVAAEAAKLAPPDRPRLKDERDLKLVGRAIPKVDIPAKVNGSAMFGIDFSMPDMLVAAVRVAPSAGGALKGFDETALRAKPGVRTVVPLQNGIAVVADTYLQARRALMGASLEFEPNPDGRFDSASVMQAYRDRLENGPFAVPVNEGNADEILKAATRTFSRDYENPFAAHAAMEPINCTAHVTAERCEIWAPTQGQELAFLALRGTLKLSDDKITVHRSQAIGGGFGRRLLPDFVVQAALISKAVGRPVKAIWDREEDMRHDYFRPATMVRLAGAIGPNGLPSAIAARVVSPTILLPVFPPLAESLKKTPVDPSAMEGMMETHYAIPNRRVEFHLLQTPIKTSVMRTTGYGPNIFAFESFIDELAYAAKIDPYQYRRRLLLKNKRALAVLDRAAALGDWGKPMHPGEGRGIAFADAFGTLLAQVIEVAVKGNAVRLKRIVSIADCGRVLDPGIASAGIEGGVVFGLAYCKAEITFRDGRAVQDNFDTYSLPTLAETPRLVTEFIEGGEKLGGIGETSPVTVPPALANAIFAATGRRLRSMPLARHGLQFA